MYPPRDITLALRAAIWDKTTVAPDRAATACSPRAGSTGSSSYALRAEWLGVVYAIEGVFVGVGSRQVQLEVISPDRRAPIARALLAAWVKRVAEP
jgi:hypothetical protein